MICKLVGAAGNLSYLKEVGISGSNKSTESWTNGELLRFQAGLGSANGKTFSLPTQECSEGGPGADAGGIQRVQEDQGQTPPVGSPHQQAGFLQIHLDPPGQISAIPAHIISCHHCSEAPPTTSVSHSSGLRGFNIYTHHMTSSWYAAATSWGNRAFI